MDETREVLAAADVPLEILPGAEIALSYLPVLDDEQLRLASVGGAGRWLLVEMPFQGWPIRLPQVLADLEIRGYGVILAHPERAEAVQRAPDRMRDIVGRGALVQLTAQSLLGELGQAAHRAAKMLLAGGVAHFIASDGHSAGPWRPPRMEEGLAAAAEADRRPSPGPDLDGGGRSRGGAGGAAGAAAAAHTREKAPGGRASGAWRAATTDSRVTPRPSASSTSARQPSTRSAFATSRALRCSSPSRAGANSGSSS